MSSKPAPQTAGRAFFLDPERGTGDPQAVGCGLEMTLFASGMLMAAMDFVMAKAKAKEY